MIYFTSDTHFADPRVLRIDRRPFATVAEHDAALIRNWNSVVQEEDEIWHLGDFMSSSRGDCDQVLSMLAGCKHLIIGNNDTPQVISSPGWASVQHYAEILVEQHFLVLCHYPFRTWNKMGKRSINLHGHSHGRLKATPRQYDVGVDAQGLRPVSLGALLKRR
ncbi:metallophosphoesterase family protein [Sinorhizobium numidicum]|uniref:Metallophosphoesterase family protein n=1 Tax=Sinorhizobium numidicum TaxID=680248 RepID=A0ABY8CSH8_9HYPH|nr:metallophosphoesterase family protein [Sinorhizobium numidicum]WEX75552.1 metallophosphoesterase family protein [Sinorhizobium numidicum]WEX81549.1 metallophosphoesterase family protein [Sinorhizobium numidicum]